MPSTIQSVKEFLEARKLGFLNQLRTKGLDAPSASFLRNSVRVLGDTALALDSEGSLTDADDESEMTITRTITTPAVDRYGDVVLPRGCEKSLQKFLRNPKVFFGHKSNELPIATAMDVRVFDDKIISVAKFHEETEEARCIWRMRKILPATSIGFLPVKASIIGSNRDEEEELEERLKKRKEKTPDGEKVVTFEPWCPLRFLEWELLEWSVVSLPANPDCVEQLTKFLSDGKVEGEPIPLSLRKSLEPFVHKGRVWAHGFDPEKEEHTGEIQLGGHLLSFDKGKIIKLDGTPTTNDPQDPVPVPNPEDDNPPGMKKPGGPNTTGLGKKKVPLGLLRDVGAGKQDPQQPCLLDLPDVVQYDHFSCGACAAMAVGRFFDKGPEDLEEWKKALGTSVEKSTHPQAIVKYLKELGLTVEERYDMKVTDLEQCWKDGHPVICPVQDYADFVPEGALWDYGHYLAVIGVTLGHVFCQDSSEDNATRGSGTIAAPGRVMIREEDWVANWHDKDEDGKEYKCYGIIVCSDNDITPAHVDPGATLVPSAGELDRKDLSPTGDSSAVPTKYDEPAKPGTDISNLDAVHAAIQKIPDLLQQSLKALTDYHAKEEERHKMVGGIHELCHKMYDCMVGQPKEDEKLDTAPHQGMEPGEPNAYNPNSTTISPELLKLLEQMVNVSKENALALSSLTGKY